MANSWMQTPQGYEIVTDPAPTRAVMTDFWQVVFTPSFLPRLLHVFFASWTAGAALMLSVSAWYLLKKRHLELAKSNFRLAPAVLHPVLAISNVVRLRGQPGDRGDPPAAAQAGLDGGPLAGHVVRAAVPRRLGGRGDPDDARGLDPVPAQRPRLPQPAGLRPGPQRLPSGPPDPADQPAVPGLSPDVHAGLAVRARSACWAGCSVPRGQEARRGSSTTRSGMRAGSCGCS